MLLFLLDSLCIYFEAMQKIGVNDFPSLSSQLRHVYIDNDRKNWVLSELWVWLVGLFMYLLL